MGRKNGARGDNFKGKESDRWLKGGTGRASTFTEELGERIINSLWTGECKSIVELSEQDWAPSRRTIQVWKDKYPEFGEALLEAQIALAELYVHENQKIVRDMLAGAIDPSAANIAIKSNQWMAPRLDPRQFADRSYKESTENKRVEHIFTNRIAVEDLSEDELDALEGALIKSKLLLTGPTQN